MRRGAADWNGAGEHVSGIVVMREGANALDVIRGVKVQAPGNRARAARGSEDRDCV